MIFAVTIALFAPLALACSSDSYGRGVGVLPSCGDDEDGRAGLCYEKCGDDYKSDGSIVCWKRCPSGWHDDGLLCRRMFPLKVITKSSHTIPAGKPMNCGGRDEEAGLCYDHCRDGYHGVGPVCYCNGDSDDKNESTAAAITLPNPSSTYPSQSVDVPSPTNIPSRTGSILDDINIIIRDKLKKVNQVSSQVDNAPSSTTYKAPTGTTSIAPSSETPYGAGTTSNAPTATSYNAPAPSYSAPAPADTNYGVLSAAKGVSIGLAGLAGVLAAVL
jgi:hypothetical protein